LVKSTKTKDNFLKKWWQRFKLSILKNEIMEIIKLCLVCGYVFWDCNYSTWIIAFICYLYSKSTDFQYCQAHHKQCQVYVFIHILFTPIEAFVISTEIFQSFCNNISTSNESPPVLKHWNIPPLCINYYIEWNLSPMLKQ
jgi:hypothetical protein